MASRSYEEVDYRRGAPNWRNDFNHGGRGRDDGDYGYPPPIYGREQTGFDDRYPQRDHGGRDFEPGDPYRAHEGRNYRGYGGGEFAGQGYDPGRYAGQVPGRRGQVPYEDPYPPRQHEPSGVYGRRGDAGQEDFARHAGEERALHEKSHQFDPDYHQWRSEQLSALDDDYRAWRGERYQKFASEFSQWRAGRSRPEEEGRGKGEKENSGKNK